MEQKTQSRKQLTKKEQNKIVSVTHTGGLPLNVGYSIGVNTKSRVPQIKTTRKRG